MVVLNVDDRLKAFDGNTLQHGFQLVTEVLDRIIFASCKVGPQNLRACNLRGLNQTRVREHSTIPNG